jgi:Fe-S cluster assembly ATPase SufC
MDIETDSNLIFLMEKCKDLNAEGKSKLVKHLLGDSSFNVTIGSSQFHVETVYQINLSSPEQIAGILSAIADKISSKNK